jgi:WD40 repeat protein
MIKSLYFLIITIIIPIFGYSQFQFNKIKEFQINSLYKVGIVDYFDSKNLYLAYINKLSKGTEIALINGKGEIILSKNLQGDGPEKFTTSMNSLGFSRGGDIWVLTTFELLLYDQNLKLKERIKFEPNTQVYIANRTYPFQYFYKNNNPSNFHFFLNPSGVHNFLGFRQFKNKYLVNLYDSHSKSNYSLAPIIKREIGQKLNENMSDVYFPIYTVDKNESPQLYLTSSFDSEITVFDLNNGAEIKNIKIKHGAFDFLKGTNLDISNLPSRENITLGAKNHNIFKLDNELIILEYIQEIPYGTYEQKIAEDPTYHHFQDPNYHRLILFEGNTQVSGDIKLPVNGKLMTALPDNRLLFQLIDPDIEEDFIRFGIYELVKSSD